MNEIIRLPKGHKVICAFPISEDRIYSLKSKGVTFTQDDDKIFIECFVSGDTDELGLSVVAIDNPKYCLISDKGTKDSLFRQSIVQGYCAAWISPAKYDVEQVEPYCPY